MPDSYSNVLHDKKISELPVADRANATDQLEANQSGTTRSITLDQVAMVVAAIGGDSTVFSGDLPPTAPTVNSLWWNSTRGELFIYYNDGTSTQWVPASPAQSVQPEYFGVLHAESVGVSKDSADNSAALLSAIYTLDARGGGELSITVPGTYMIGATVQADLVNPLAIYLGAGVVLKGDATGTAVLRLRGLDTARPHIRITGSGTIDSSLRPYIPAVASGTGLELIRTGPYHIEGITFKAATGFGDSGIASENSSIGGTIAFCNFFDHPDIGIYLTGGGNPAITDDSGDVVVTGCLFQRCAIGITARRGIPRCIISNNRFLDGGAGVQTSEAGSSVPDTWLPAGREINIVGNRFFNMGNSAVDLRVSAPGSVVSNNAVVNFAQTVGFSGIALLGTTAVLCVGNTIIRDTGPANGAAAISVSNYTDQGGTLHTSVGNVVSGNLISGAEVGLRNLGSATAVVIHGSNPMTGVATPYSGIATYPAHGELGMGFGTMAPETPLHVIGKARIGRIDIPEQFIEIESNVGQLDFISYSASTAAKNVRFRATTNAAHTAPSAGNTDISFDTRGSQRMVVKDTGQVRFQPLAADPTRAEAGDIYYNSVSNLFRFYNGTVWGNL